MHTEVIKANTIDEAAKRILEELKEEYDDATSTARIATGSSWHNVIYFDGWDGLGASAVLRAIGQRLSTGPEFSQIIHIDCSKWESRRAMQRVLAVQLRLPAHVIEMLDAQDEEDDYNGVGQGSRLEIPKVAREIYEHVQKQLNQRFLAIFNNGSCEEIDLESFGFPLSGYSRNKALWSFQGRFRLYPRVKVDRALESKRASSTDVVLSATSSNVNEDKFSDILRHEAEDVTKGTASIGGIDRPAVAISCFLYTMRLCAMGGYLMDYDLAIHGCSYWICDGMIQLQPVDVDATAETLWLSCDALKREMRLDSDYHQSPWLPASPVVRRLQERMAYWTSPAYGTTLIKDQCGRIPKGMFQQYDKLCVLKLSACTFSLRCPPFLCCHSLRFLWLDHCREDESSSTDNGAAANEDIRGCFQNLWVLDVRYSSSNFLSAKMMDFMAQLMELHVMGQEEFDMDTLQGRVCNIRKLRVTKSNTNCNKGAYLLSGKDKMEHIELTGNGGSMKSLSVESSSCSSLETVIIDGCVSLEGISLKGWAKPKNLVLSGSFPNLRSLDLSGAAVKTLDLSAVMAPKLDELILLYCVNLTAILWPPVAAAGGGEGRGSGKRYLGKLCIDTTQREAITAAGGHDTTGKSRRTPEECAWYICVRDARFLGSLEPVKDYFGDHDEHMDMSSSRAVGTVDGSKDAGRRIKSSIGQQMLPADVDLQKLVSNRDDDDNATNTDDVAAIPHKDEEQADDDDDSIHFAMSPCPVAPRLSSQGCYMHIDAAGRITVPGFICDGAKTLHMRDNWFITGILPAPSGSIWNQLEWCRVERCPKLEAILFSAGWGERRSSGDAFGKLRTLWASSLLNAHCVWVHSGPTRGHEAFKDLKLLHLNNCPRLTYGFSLYETAFQSLETLEIMWCGNLRVIFHFPEQPLHYGRMHNLVFPKLQRIHLHELPALDHMWAPDTVPMFTPKLMTVKTRGCWRLRKLPSKMPMQLGRPPINSFMFSKIPGMVSCDCEKEWWDELKWYSDMQRSDYKPIHSHYYKKTFIRGPALG